MASITILDEIIEKISKINIAKDLTIYSKEELIIHKNEMIELRKSTELAITDFPEEPVFKVLKDQIDYRIKLIDIIDIYGINKVCNSCV